jgi:hypothetical protein
MKHALIKAIAAIALFLGGCVSVSILNQQDFERFSIQWDLSVVYCGNKDGYAFFRWHQPTIPLLAEKRGKILLSDARMLRGWVQREEFSYTNDSTKWIGAYRICDIILSPDEKSGLQKSLRMERGKVP